MQTQPNRRVRVKTEDSQGALPDTDVTITLAADSNQWHVVDAIQWSYSTAAVAGNLTVAIGGTTVFQLDITAGDADTATFPRGLYGAKGEDVVVTLAGATSATGRLALQYR